MPELPECSRIHDNSLSGFDVGFSTPKNRLGRSNPVVMQNGSRNARSVSMSALTLSVAVAVNAPTVGLSGNPEMNSAIFR